MNDQGGSLFCMAVTWSVAALAALAGGVMLMLIGGWMFMQAVFAAALIFVALGAFLAMTICRPLAPLGTPLQVAGTAPVAGTRPLAAPVAPVAVAPTPVSAPEPVVEPVADAPQSEGMAQPIPEPAPTIVAADPARPVALSAPRGGTADNLKEIKGIGPKLEVLLHSLGFYHFDQIAAWTPAELAWVDSNLEGFKGRASRDDWVGQAKVLASGGETEFSTRVDKGGVY